MQYSIRISFSSLIIAVLFMYLTIEVLTHSVDVFKMHFKRYIVWIVLAVIIIGLIIGINWIYLEGADISTVDYNMIVFGPFAGYIAILLLFSMIKLYLYGIRKAEGKAKLSMVSFFVGLLFMFMGLIIEGLGSVFEGYEVIFDIGLFLALSLGVLFMALSLLRKK